MQHNATHKEKEHMTPSGFFIHTANYLAKNVPSLQAMQITRKEAREFHRNARALELVARRLRARTRKERLR
jgi:hypothetical protein